MLLLTPTERYQRDLDTGDFLSDPQQQRVVAALEALHRRLLAPPRRGWRRSADAPTGLYIWGPVGRGKTYLMDSFYQALPEGVGLRLHFHRFMQRIHRALARLSGQSDPLRQIARDLASEARVLCFDEFFVADIGDAMILANLLDTLFAEGVTLVATSNLAPDQLYRDGLQRQRFVPAIELLNQRTRVIALDGKVDYRRRVTVDDHYLTPLDAASEAELRRRFDRLAGARARYQSVVRLSGRAVPVRGVAEKVVWFDFASLCDGPRSTLDYIELSQRFRTLVLSEVPVLGGNTHRRKVAIGTEDSLENSIAGIDRSVQEGWQDDAARRFIALVDELYDRGTRLIISAAAPVDRLYRGGRVAFEFERTRSRLIEMQSVAYGRRSGAAAL